MLREVRAEPREGRLIELVPFLGELTQDARLGLHVVEDQAVRDQMVVLDQLALPVAVVLGDQTLAAEEQPLDEAVERLALVGRGLDDATKLGVVEIPQEEGGPDDTAQLLEGLIEAVLPAVGPELAQQGRGRDPARPDREDHAQHVGQVRLDERPIDHVREQRVDVLVARGLRGPEERQALPVANPGHEVDAQQVGEAEDRGGLPLGVGMDRVRLDVRPVLQQPIQDVDRLPHAARDEVAEQRHVGVRDVIVADAAVPAVADVVLGEQVLLVEVPLHAVRRGVLPRAPELREREAIVRVDQGGDGLVEVLLGDVPLIDPRDLPAVEALQGPSGLGRPQVAAVAERGRHVPGS